MGKLRKCSVRLWNFAVFFFFLNNKSGQFSRTKWLYHIRKHYCSGTKETHWKKNIFKWVFHGARLPIELTFNEFILSFVLPCLVFFRWCFELDAWCDDDNTNISPINKAGFFIIQNYISIPLQTISLTFTSLVYLLAFQTPVWGWGKFN